MRLYQCQMVGCSFVVQIKTPPFSGRKEALSVGLRKLTKVTGLRKLLKLPRLTKLPPEL